MNFRRNVLYQWAGVSVFILFAVALAVRGDWMWRIDQVLYDAALRLWQRPPSPEIVIVGIDEASLAQLGRWPWPRSLHAQIVDRLTRAGAKAIGFDVIFSEPDTPANDARFARAIAASGRVALPVHISFAAQPRIIRPVAALAEHARLAHVHVELDLDGMARSVYLREGLGQPEFPHLSAALVAVAFGNDVALPGLRRAAAATDPGTLVRDYWMHIPYAGPPGHFAKVSYVDVLQGRVADAVFRDRMVLVGAVAQGMLDSYPTPVSGSARPMPGVEISANAIDAVRLGADVAPVSAATRMSLSLLALLMPLAGLLWLTPRRAFLLAAGSSVAILLAAIIAARHPGLWFAPSIPALAALIAYPLWSWRRLEAAQLFLESELEVMGQEVDAIELPARVRWQQIADPIERRIAAVRLASARLRSARRFIADVLDNLPQATIVVDAQDRLMLGNQNAASLCGAANVDGLHGLALSQLLAGLQTSGGMPLVEALQAGDAPLEAISSGGQAFLVSAAPLHDDDGLALGSIISLTDITELKNAQRKREEYMAFLSHDMRSPQVSILAMLELARLAPERTPKNLNERIEAFARKTLELADDFVQLARAEEQDAAAFQPVDLAATLRDAIDEQTPLAARKSMTIGATGAEVAAMVNGDQQLLVRAISNLLSNAVKYSESGSHVSCALACRDGAWSLAIQDRGHGIAAEDLPHLFDRFSRFDAPGATRVAGAGLGLAFVKTVFDKHGAAIDARSELGKGTTFTVTFNRTA